MKVAKILATCLVALLLVSLCSIFHLQRLQLKILDIVLTNGTSLREGEEQLRFRLIAPKFDSKSCLSRFQTSIYRKNSSHKPSPYLLSKLRNYEKLHRQCGPHTESYNKSIKQIKSGQNFSFNGCKYVVWISCGGLGNRIMSIASAFLYALLTNRVLLVDFESDMDDLFCEPFPETSWLLPLDFPMKDQFEKFDQKYPHSYGNMLKKNMLNISTKSFPSHLYLYLVHDYDDQDQTFFLDEYQSLIAKVPWLMIRTDNYYIPFLFLMHSFDRELSSLFPENGTVFHHLGRYLFNPSNHVWGLITRSYQAYLAKANERIGIQVRTFEAKPGPFQYVMDQILACTTKEKLLPEVDKEQYDAKSNSPQTTPKHKVILMTSLSSRYFEVVKDLYREYPTVNGDVIGVYQPSHEGHQQTEKQSHNKKAWAEMYLLSLTDVLVTSAWSTFGYVAQGLGGLTPWILYHPENQSVPDPPCGRVTSMEPCFHIPPFYDIETKRGVDSGLLAPHVRHCEDWSWGLKLVDS